MKIDRRIIIAVVLIIAGYFLFKKVFAKNSTYTEGAGIGGEDKPAYYI